MSDRSRTFYVKPYTMFGKTKVVLGDRPTYPDREPGFQLGGFFLHVASVESGVRIAKAYVDNVVVCDTLAL